MRADIDSLSLKDTYLMLVKTKSADNNNKFYELTLLPDGSVQARYGRVDGKSVQVRNKGHGIHKLLSVAREKMSDDYYRVEVIKEDSVKQDFSSVVKRDVAKNDPVLSDLVDRLIAINRHQLMEASGGKITIKDGQVCTAVGLITLRSVAKAESVLQSLAKEFKKGNTTTDSYLSNLDQYLTLIPQKVPHQRGWGPTFFEGVTTFERQFDLLDQLRSSISATLNELKEGKAQKELEESPKMFQYSIKLVSNKEVIKKIESFYKKTSNSLHASHGLKLKRVYEVSNPDAEKAYGVKSSKIGNLKSLWHGSRACNLLSILKMGLIVPNAHDRNFTISGRMFGNGLYFSDQSTKALNYSYGYWNGSREPNCFMFLCDVAMGREYVPLNSGNGKKAGYDSCFAMANHSGVKNNEMIVYDVAQANLRYLCEFER